MSPDEPLIAIPDVSEIPEASESPPEAPDFDPAQVEQFLASEQGKPLVEKFLQKELSPRLQGLVDQELSKLSKAAESGDERAYKKALKDLHPKFKEVGEVFGQAAQRAVQAQAARMQQEMQQRTNEAQLRSLVSDPARAPELQAFLRTGMENTQFQQQAVGVARQQEEQRIVQLFQEKVPDQADAETLGEAIRVYRETGTLVPIVEAIVDHLAEQTAQAMVEPRVAAAIEAAMKERFGEDIRTGAHPDLSPSQAVPNERAWADAIFDRPNSSPADMRKAYRIRHGFDYES